MNLNVRDARESDIGKIIKLGTEVDGFAVSDDDEIFWSEDSLESWIDSNKDVCLVAESGYDLVGFVLSHIHEPTGKVEIENIYVKKDFRREGVAERLYDELMSEYDSMDASFVVSLVKKDNHVMHGFSKKMDFDKGENIIWWEYEL